MNSKIDMATNAKQFAYVCEAFEVLSNPEYKAIYDAYGEKILKHGFDSGLNMNFEGVYQFKGNANEIFNSYFDTGKEFKDKPTEIETNYLSHFSHFEEAKRLKEEEERNIQKPHDLQTTIICNFTDLTEGGLIKDVILKGTEIETNVESLKSLDLHKVIPIPKGADPKSPYVFCLQGLLKNHPQEAKALASKYLNIPMDIVEPKTVIKIPNEGFSYSEKVEIDDPDNIDNEEKRYEQVIKRGDLYIKFNIKFPAKLTLEQRQQMAEVIRGED
mmetsp:Transcript_3151/g.3762  ORF Transcript_3151/g.3762 Transcript_3151/m.3762 type:complete len:272 (+) Transcript_3151:77-892(+)